MIMAFRSLVQTIVHRNAFGHCGPHSNFLASKLNTHNTASGSVTVSAEAAAGVAYSAAAHTLAQSVAQRSEQSNAVA